MTGRHMTKKEKDAAAALERVARARAKVRYVLKLYVAGVTRKSEAAIRAVTEICETHLKERYELEIIDIYQQPHLARGEQIVAVPTLIKKLPAPLRKMIGDLADQDKVLFGLDLKPK